MYTTDMEDPQVGFISDFLSLYFYLFCLLRICMLSFISKICILVICDLILKSDI